MNILFLSYDHAKKFVQKVLWNGKKISSSNEFRSWAKSGKRPMNIPANLERHYKKVWKKNGGWSGFLGTGTIPTQNRSYRSFKKARRSSW